MLPSLLLLLSLTLGAAAAPVDGAETLDQALQAWETDPGQAKALLDQAVAKLEASAAAAPANPDAHAKLGIALYYRGADAEARAALERALELDPVHGDALYMLAVLSGDQGRLDETVALWKRLRDANPDDMLPRWNHAQALQLAGRHAEALAAFQGIFEADPREWRALAKVIQLQEALGDRAGRDATIAQLHALRRAGELPELSEAQSYVRDQFPLGPYQVVVAEHFELVGERGVAWRFHVEDPQAGQPAAVISLGSYEGTNRYLQQSGQVPEGERGWHLDLYTPDGTHATLGFFLRGKPSYDDIKPQVRAFLEGGEGAPVPLSMTVPTAAAAPPKSKQERRKERRRQKKEAQQ